MGCFSAKHDGTNSLMFLLSHSVGMQCFIAFQVSLPSDMPIQENSGIVWYLDGTEHFLRSYKLFI
jgi:hypothetical protein